MSANNPSVVIGVAATDTASKVLDNVDCKVAILSTDVERTGDKVETSTKKMSATSTAHWAQMATSVATLGAGLVSFATSFDTLEKAQVRAQQANLTYQKAQAHLEELQRSGKASADDIARAQQAVSIASDKARLAQDAQSDTYTNFLANVPLQMISFGTSAITMLTSMQGATGALSTAMGVFRSASIMAFITNPVGIAIIGITTLVALLVFNVGGLRDMFVNLGKIILDFLDAHFKPLADGIRWFLGLFGQTTDAVGKDMPASTTAAMSGLDSMQASAVDTGAAIGDMSSMVGASAAQMSEFQTTADQAATVTAQSFSSASSSTVKSVDIMNNSFDKMISRLKTIISLQAKAGLATNGGSHTSVNVDIHTSDKNTTASVSTKQTTLRATSQKLAGVGI
jgi:hypothetical protein